MRSQLRQADAIEEPTTTTRSKQSLRAGQSRYGLRPSRLRPHNTPSPQANERSKELQLSTADDQKSASTPGSIFGRHGGSIFNRRRHATAAIDLRLLVPWLICERLEHSIGRIAEDPAQQCYKKGESDRWWERPKVFRRFVCSEAQKHKEKADSDDLRCCAPGEYGLQSRPAYWALMRWAREA
jgi:hypothetical protein